jgi:hypothetical protein
MQPPRRITRSRSLLLPAILLTALAFGSQPCIGQETPVISGAIGFFTNTNKGPTSFTPILTPVVALPMTHRFLFETRDYLTENITPRKNNLSDQTKFFKGVSYLQVDYLAAPHLTLVAGKILTPFATFNERLSPIWIGNFQDGPLTFPIGNVGGGGVGGEARGSAVSTSKVNIDYAYFFFSHVGGTNFSSTRSTGGRVEAYFPSTGVEIGTSYDRTLEGTQRNAIGAHFWWEPPGGALTVRSEYAHGPHSQGYWIETGYRLSEINGPDSFVGRIEPLFRMQQTFRNSTDFTDGLPSADLQRADFGLDYFLPHNTRIITSYSRQFSSIGNGNIWKTGIVYRFLFPAWPGKIK